MKITEKRQVNLPELIKWAWENGENGTFTAINNKNIEVEIMGSAVNTNLDTMLPEIDTRFEITEEVGIDEDTVFDEIMVINDEDEIESHRHISVNQRLTSENHKRFGTKSIFIGKGNDSFGPRIWQNGRMIK